MFSIHNALKKWRYKRFWGRFFALQYLLKAKKDEIINKPLDYLTVLGKFLVQGNLPQKGYYYTHYLLLRAPNVNDWRITEDIFNKRLYNLNIPTKVGTIIDLGCHLGFSLIYFSQKYKEAKIYGYEANPKIFNCLRENVAYNIRSDRVRVKNLCVTSGTQPKRNFFYNDQYFASGSLSKKHSKNFNQCTQVKTINLTKILEENKIIDLLKIDIEGEEYQLITQLIKYRKKIRYFIIEFHKVNDKNKLQKIAALSDYYDLTMITNCNDCYYQVIESGWEKRPQNENMLIVAGKSKTRY